MAQKGLSHDVMGGGRTIHGLQNCLARKTIPQLRRLAANLHLNGTSKLRKNELIGVIRNDLLRPERLEAVLYGLEEPEWILFQKCSGQPMPTH